MFIQLSQSDKESKILRHLFRRWSLDDRFHLLRAGIRPSPVSFHSVDHDCMPHLLLASIQKIYLNKYSSVTLQECRRTGIPGPVSLILSDQKYWWGVGYVVSGWEREKEKEKKNRGVNIKVSVTFITSYWELLHQYYRMAHYFIQNSRFCSLWAYTSRCISFYHWLNGSFSLDRSLPK